MFNGNFVEGSSGEATFPEDSVQAFDLLLEWVYSNTIRPLTSDDKPTKAAAWESSGLLHSCRQVVYYRTHGSNYGCNYDVLGKE